jgi:hypothetical protein
MHVEKNEKNHNIITSPLIINHTGMETNTNTKNAFSSNYVEIEKFVMQYEDKIYFYDSLFDYMSSFVKRKNIKYLLSREKPRLLGILIENILRDWLKCKKNIEKYKSQLKNLFSNK